MEKEKKEKKNLIIGILVTIIIFLILAIISMSIYYSKRECKIELMQPTPQNEINNQTKNSNYNYQ